MSSTNNLKIVFMGTPDFATTILETLLERKYNIVAVITAPDKPAGRGRKLNESSVKKYALKQRLPILQPKNLKNKEFVSELKSYNPDIQIVVAFRMLPKIVWKMPKFGTFNLHASLLPAYRGAAPIHWAIINGETKTGVTTFFIDDKIDTGEIILQTQTPISPNETVGTLHNTLMHLGADLVCKTLELIKKDSVLTQKQPTNSDKLAPKLTQENTQIDWNNSTKAIYNMIRGLNPFPAAWTEIKNQENFINAKIYDVEKQLENHSLQPGTIITDKKSIRIASQDGFIIINKIKLAGKKLMDTTSLLNGYSFDKNAKAL